jgi:hypothetical protein
MQAPFQDVPPEAFDGVKPSGTKAMSVPFRRKCFCRYCFKHHKARALRLRFKVTARFGRVDAPPYPSSDLNIYDRPEEPHLTDPYWTMQ